MRLEQLLEDTRRFLEKLRKKGPITKYPTEFNNNIYQLSKNYSDKELSNALNMARSSIRQIVQRFKKGSKKRKTESKQEIFNFVELTKKHPETIANSEKKVFMKLRTSSGIVVELFE